jgi:hypothetical protein
MPAKRAAAKKQMKPRQRLTMPAKKNVAEKRRQAVDEILKDRQCPQIATFLSRKMETFARKFNDDKAFLKRVEKTLQLAPGELEDRMAARHMPFESRLRVPGPTTVAKKLALTGFRDAVEECVKRGFEREIPEEDEAQEMSPESD